MNKSNFPFSGSPSESSFPLIEIEIATITARFGRSTIWRNLTATLHGGMITGIIGRNGRGKSPLLKMLSGVLLPAEGTVTHRIDGQSIAREHLYRSIGFVAPYIALYDEFTPIEHLQIHADLHGVTFNISMADLVIQSVGLSHRRSDRISTFSSGLLQRMKCAIAIALNPSFLILDEPCSNLDDEGYTLVEQIIRRHAKRGGIVILATNDERERMWCDTLLDIEKYIP